MIKIKTQIVILLCLCIASSNALKAQTCSVQDSMSLLSLYNSINGLAWDLSQPVNTWYGVTLNSNGCVEELKIWGYFHTGFIPAEIGDLQHLKKLDISGTNISGVIPPEISNLSNLESLELDYNSLYGIIPVEIGNISSLKLLKLGNNNLSGSIPPELGNLSNLESLQLQGNSSLDGTIPSELGNLSNLEALHLQYCSLTGTVPVELSLLQNLTSLRLESNSLYGTIPVELGLLSSLIALRLSHNTLSGSIPAELGDLANLVTLSLSDNNLSGTLPSSLSNLSNLTTLHINDNNLTGSIPEEYVDLSSLNYFYINNNSLSGCYEEELSGLCLTLGLSYFLNNSISDGNNFDADFLTFCLSDDGLCIYSCADSTALTYDPNTTYQIANCVYENSTCYAVSESNGAPNTLFNYNEITQLWSPIGHTGSAYMEAIEFDHSSGILYAYDAGLFGSIDLANAMFTGIGSAGQADGELGLLSLSDIDGLGYDAHEEIMYATLSRSGTSNDVLFQVDISTGAAVSGAMKDSFGNPTDYALIGTVYDSSNTAFYSVDDIAIHPANGELYGLHSATGKSIISIIDKCNGTIVQQLYTITNYNLEGLTFNNNLELIGTTGNGSGIASNSQLLIDYNNQTIVDLGQIDPNGSNVDFESIACYQSFIYGCTDSLAYNYNPLASFSDGSCIYPDDCRIQDSLNLKIVLDNLGYSGYEIFPMSYWPGSLQFDANGCVTYINLDDWGASGPIPPEIGNLSQLVYFNLRENSISGPLPIELFSLTNLEYLHLSANQITGPIPPEIENLLSLKVLSIGTNDLSGPIPSQIGNLPNLEELDLAGNDLTGSIPSEIGNLSELEHLNLAGNNLTGSIPIEIAALDSLTFIAVSNNALSGCYDPQLASLCSIVYFTTTFNAVSSGNNFDDDFEDFCDYNFGMCYTGCQDPMAFNYDPNAILDDGSCIYYDCSIQDSLTLITVYTSMGLSSSPWSLGQPVDTWPGVVQDQFGCVTELWLDDLNLSGSIPADIGDLSSLIIISLEDNNLTGSIPTEIGDLSNLEYLNLSQNILTGGIPAEIGNLTRLEYLNLSINANLSGAIPIELSDLFYLEELYLSYNNLTGEIPSEFGGLYNVQVIDLSNNNLTGSIPSDIASLGNLTLFRVRDNYLSGCYHPLLQSLCNPLGALSSATNSINTGNNFDDTWYNFCLYDTAVCCEDSVYVNVVPYYSGRFTAEEYLSSDVPISGFNKEFEAGMEIELLPGFELESDANFSAEIGGCD